MYDEHKGHLQQGVYWTFECGCWIDHARLMVGKSINDHNLQCSFSKPQKWHEGKKRMGQSKHERTAMRNLCTYPTWQADGYDMVITEARLWQRTSTDPLLQNERLDFLICNREHARARDFTDALCLFIDGEHHFPWRRKKPSAALADSGNWKKPAEQRRVDLEVARAAAAHGHCVVRVCYKDARTFLSIVRAAWERRRSSAVFVSKHWNSGAHQPRRLEAM